MSTDVVFPRSGYVLRCSDSWLPTSIEYFDFEVDGTELYHLTGCHISEDLKCRIPFFFLMFFLKRNDSKSVT